MQYVEAFKKLGYMLDAPRQDWSAQKDGGVCITIWQKERSIADGLPYLDLWGLHPSGADFEGKPGHSKRTKHRQMAMDQFGGQVDAIFVSGTPGESYENASPWIVEERKGITGTFRNSTPLPATFAPIYSKNLRPEAHPKIGQNKWPYS